MVARLRDSEGFEANVKPQFRGVTLLAYRVSPRLCDSSRSPVLRETAVSLFLIKGVFHGTPRSQLHSVHFFYNFAIMSSETPASAATGLTVTSPRLTSRTAVPSDGEALVAYFSNPANFPWPVEKDLTLEKMLPRIDKWADATEKGRSAFMVIVLRETDELIGFGGFNSLPRTEPLRDQPVWRIRKSSGEESVLVADIGVGIDHQHQRKGYAREAVCAALEYGFENLGCAYAHLDTQKSNEPMKALMGGLGISGIEGDDSEPLEDAAFCFASKSINYIVDKATWSSRREELKSKTTWPL